MNAHATSLSGRRPLTASSLTPLVSGDLVAVLVSAFVALEIGVAVAVKPVAALLPAGLLGCILLLVDARVRLFFLVIGGLLTLQSSNSFGSLKLLYLAGVLVSFAGALFRFSRTEDRFNRRLAMPLLRASMAMIGLILISYMAAQQQGTPRTDWLRDVAPYALFAFAPIFALDAQSSTSRRTLVRLLVIAGIIATFSFATHWLEERQIAQLPFSRFALSSFFFPAALFAFAVASALHVSRRQVLWGFVALLVFALLIVTGTRTSLILALVPIIAVASARRHASTRFVRLALAGPIVLLLVLGLGYAFILASHASTKIISDRISILKVTGSSSDASYLDRMAETHAADQVFDAHPIFGAGPGTYFNWTETNGTPVTEFVLDSPVDFPAKFGIVGLAVIAFVLVNYAWFVKATFRVNHPRPETLALASFGAVAVAGAFLATPIEDKGLTLGLILLLALVFRTVGPPSAGSASDRRPVT